MKVLKVIVDEMPKECNQDCPFERDWECIAHDWEQLYAEDFGKIPAWCPLEVETDGWIPVEERLPENDVRVIMLRSDGYVEIGSRGYDMNQKELYWFSDDNWKVFNITHWKPLPEPRGEE